MREIVMRNVACMAMAPFAGSGSVSKLAIISVSLFPQCFIGTENGFAERRLSGTGSVVRSVSGTVRRKALPEADTPLNERLSGPLLDEAE
jgi:hypothetical protein